MVSHYTAFTYNDVFFLNDCFLIRLISSVGWGGVGGWIKGGKGGMKDAAKLSAKVLKERQTVDLVEYRAGHVTPRFLQGGDTSSQ